MKNLKVSVVIPTFNRQNTIIKTIESVLNQSLRPDEIIVIDDGSNDNTKYILKEYLEKIVYIFQDNLGVSSARNKGINVAKNRWIAFLDSDDIWHKDKLKIQIDFHEKNKNFLWSHTNEVWIKNNIKVNKKKHQQKFGGDVFDKALNQMFISPSSVIINKDIFDKVGLFDENLPVCEDYDLWLRVLSFYQIGYIDIELVDKIAKEENNQLSTKYWGMDRFRIKSLYNLWEKTAKEMLKSKIEKNLLQKVNLLMIGAIKHKNLQLIDDLNNILHKIKL